MKILTLPDKRLHKVCKHVTSENWKSAMSAAQAMSEVMFHEYEVEKADGSTVKLMGVGVAANQVGHDQRVFVMSPKYDKEEIRVVINPKILSHGKEIIHQPEFCLSCPGMEKFVPRWAVIEVAYLNEAHEVVEKKLKRWEARIFQHETDHLDGIICMEKEGGPTCGVHCCLVCGCGKE